MCSYLIFLGNCRLLAKNQKYQVLLFTTQLCGNLTECQIVSQILHLHLYQLFPLKSCGSEALAEVAEKGTAFRLVGAGRAKILLTVQADVLVKRRGTASNRSTTACDRGAQQPQAVLPSGKQSK